MNQGAVAVTGATGFLGRRIVGRLLRAGCSIRILVRNSADTLDLRDPAIEQVEGDLRDADALRSLVKGADTIVHAAGLIKARSRQSFFEVNETGAMRLAQACDGRRLVHVSSLAAREPQLSDYAASKRAGEQAAQEMGGSAVTIVRPPMIYGPGDRETLVLFKAARAPFIIAPGDPHARLAVANVDDVASLIVDLINWPRISPMITIGGNRPNGYSWPEIITATARAVGGGPTIVSVPKWLLEVAGAVVEGTGHWRKQPPIFTRGKAREAAHLDWSVSVAEQGETAGRNYTPLEKGFADTAAWYRQNGWIR